MKPARIHGFLLASALICSLCAAPPAGARSVTIIPKTQHSALTLTTDGSYGFMVKPGAPLKLDLVGPGRLTITVRLNSSRKTPSFKGVFQIKRNNKRIKKAPLKLFRSRVGAYEEDSKIQPSMPKVFNVRVPAGVQNYTFSLAAKRGVTMTLGIDYDTKADQAAAQGTDDLALVPLVAPGVPEPEDVPLVALAVPEDKPAPDDKKPDEADLPVAVPLVKPDQPKKVEEPIEPVDEPKPPKPVVVAKPEDKPKPAVVVPVKPKPVEKDEKPPVVAGAKPGDLKPGEVRTIEPKPVTGPGVDERAPAKSSPFLSLGAKVGQISPLQSIGGTTYTIGLDLRYVLPVFDGRLSAGLAAGFHQYSVRVSYDNTATDVEADLTVIPISLQLFYRIPLGTFIEPFLGAGADLLLTWADVGYRNDSSTKDSGSAIGFGGHVTAGVEANLGPGFLFVEVAAGFSSVDVQVMSGVNVSGLSTTAGYRFEF